ncbi:hypothetical protein P355_1469 [Burkholderia cenocepacia KC-01]|nr:hypothetical protein P355_1469 [Burkholderia cenocepacia KC-01]
MHTRMPADFRPDDNGGYRIPFSEIVEESRHAGTPFARNVVG